MRKGENIAMTVFAILGGCFVGFLFYIVMYNFGDLVLSKDKPNRYQAYSVEGNPIAISKKDGAFFVDAIDKETHSLMVPATARGERIGKILIDNPTETSGVIKTVARGDVYEYKDTVIYVADYTFDNRYDYAVLKGSDAKRVKKLFK